MMERENPIDIYPNIVAKDTREVLRIPAWRKSFKFTKRELERTLERDVLPAAIFEFPTVRRMTLGMNCPMVVPSLHARATVDQHQNVFMDSWDPLFIGYLAAVYFHTCEIKINSWTTQAAKMRGSMPSKYEVWKVRKTHEKAEFESKLPISDDGRMIVEESHLALKDDMKFSTRKHLAPHGLQEAKLQQQGRKLDAAGVFYVLRTENKVADQRTPSPLSVGSPGDKRNLPVEKRFTDALETIKPSQERGKLWTKPSARLEKKLRWGLRPTKGQRTGISSRYHA